MSASGIARRLTTGGILLPRPNVRELFSCCFGSASSADKDGNAGKSGNHSNGADGDPLRRQPGLVDTKRYGSYNDAFLPDDNPGALKGGSKATSFTSTHSRSSASKRTKGFPARRSSGS